MTRTPDHPPEPASADTLAALVRAFEGLEVIEGGSELVRLSRDCFDYSPVLQPFLAGHLAQLVVRPHDLDGVKRVAGACARHGVALTPRGAGTGNYGQCVPLAGGVVLDLSRLNRLRQIDPATGAVTAEAGCLLADLDRQMAPHGRALRLTPSTYRSATLGGFIAGGSGGIGSIRWGFLRDPGHLLGLEVVTVEPQPRVLQLGAAASRALNHAYGTNGLLTALTLATTATVDWQQLVVEFDRWDGALTAARALTASALLLNALCLLEQPLAQRLPSPSGCPPVGGHRMLLLAAPDALPVLEGWWPDLEGRAIWKAPQATGRGVPLRELTWNHTTLHVRAKEPGWTYLQLLLPQPEGPAIEALRHRWGDDLLWHLEAVRQQGAARLAALPLVVWRGEGPLNELMAQVKELGGVIFNPHAITVEEGGLGVIDADQVAAKAAHDPQGLLNPLKLRGWLER